MYKTGLILLLTVAVSSSAASEHREQRAHEHGVAEFNIALAETTVTLELHSPAYNLFGFEHSPNTAEQQQAVTERLATLTKTTVLFEFDPKTACVLLTADIQNPFEHGVESHEDDETEHTDIELTYHYRCSETVNSLDLQGLLTQFPYFDTLKVQWVSEAQQGAQTITQKNSRIQFQ